MAAAAGRVVMHRGVDDRDAGNGDVPGQGQKLLKDVSQTHLEQLWDMFNIDLFLLLLLLLLEGLFFFTHSSPPTIDA
jgi:hypothetical protein